MYYEMCENKFIKYGETCEIFKDCKVPIIEGFLTENSRWLTDKAICKILKKQSSQKYHYKIRELVNNNIDNFVSYIDYIDLKELDTVMNISDVLEKSEYTREEIIKSKNIYIFPERGFIKLMSLVDIELPWEVYQNLTEKYFINDNLQQKIENLIHNLNKNQQIDEIEFINNIIEKFEKSTKINLSNEVNNLKKYNIYEFNEKMNKLKVIEKTPSLKKMFIDALAKNIQLLSLNRIHDKNNKITKSLIADNYIAKFFHEKVETIREIITYNYDIFIEDVDYMVDKSYDNETFYIFTTRGFLKFLTFIDSCLSWDIYDAIISRISENNKAFDKIDLKLILENSKDDDVQC